MSYHFIRKYILILVCLLSCSLSSLAYASLSCSQRNDLINRVLPLNIPEITAGDDLPNGSVLATIGFLTLGASDYSARCTFDVGTGPSIEVLSFGKLINTTGTLSTFNTYATNVPGIGIRVRGYWNGSSYWLNNIQDKQHNSRYLASGGCADATASTCIISNLERYLIEFIKIGPIGNGSINGAQLPRISSSFQFRQNNNYSNKFYHTLYTFSGVVNIKSASCKTPDNYIVDLKKHEIQAIQTNNASPWVDASIQLYDCPSFKGMPKNTIIYRPDEYEGPIIYEKNSLEITYTPLTTIRNAANGSFSIETGSQSASGVDIQLRSGTVTNNNALSLNTAHKLPIENSNQSSIRIPLVARYIRNNEPLRPGKANAKLTYLINYK